MSRLHNNVSWKSSAHQKHKGANRPLKSSLTLDESAPTFELQSSNERLRSPQTFFVPMHYEANYRYPLVVWLHSDGSNENQIEHVMPHISMRNYLGLGVRGTRAADSVGHQFDWHQSMAAVDMSHEKVLSAIAECADRYSVHSQRIVLAGFGSGGTMALRLALRDPSRFAGVASFGGRMPQGRHAFGDFAEIRRNRVRMLWQWAKDNPEYQQESLSADIQAAQLIRARVEIRQHNHDTEMNSLALSDFDDWIMRHIVGSAVSDGSDATRTDPICFSAN